MDIIKNIVFGVGVCTIVAGVLYFINELRKFGIAKLIWPDRFI